MEKLAIHCSRADAKVLSNRDICAQLPLATLEIIRSPVHALYLDTLARAVLLPNLTDQLFVIYEPLIVDLAARWCNQIFSKDPRSSIEVLACFSKVLPAKPCLKILLQDFLNNCQSGFIGCLADSSQLHLLDLDVKLLSSLLLALFRLYSYNVATYGDLVSPVQLSSLLQHESPAIRYLAVRCLSQYMLLANAIEENMLSAHVPELAVSIWVDNDQVPTRLFSLSEERRWRNLNDALIKASEERNGPPVPVTRLMAAEMLSPQTAAMAGILLPRAAGTTGVSSLVNIPSTVANLERLAEALLKPNGILLTGPSGSGKTLLVTEAAKLLNKLSSMVTLHLNEQTDAKSLLGVYTTSVAQGSFVWQPGVLSRAMTEGRWVLIEDIDRAPAEVIGLIQPVIEHGEILIPSRNETIRAATGFCLLATSALLGFRGNTNNGRMQSKLNPRIWNMVNIELLPSAELETLLLGIFPMLQPYASSFLSVHNHVEQLFEQGVFRTRVSRKPSLRDLLKWCRRSQSRLKAVGVRTGVEPVNETVVDDLLREAVSCYAGHLSNPELHLAVATSIAEMMQIPPQKLRHCVYDHLPSLAWDARRVRVGRASCPIITTKHQGSGGGNEQKPVFALTTEMLRTLEEVTTTVEFREPTLLVGETGIGKTTMIQHLATLVGQRVNAFNLSQQSESSDLLGGFKPVTTRSSAIPMSETFEVLFDNTFSIRKNVKFQATIHKCISKASWTRLASLWQEAVDMAQKALQTAAASRDETPTSPPNKRRKLQEPKYEGLRHRWQDFARSLSHFKAQIARGDKNIAFNFVEGKLVQALRNGEWVLLDEINLATPETLENIADLLFNHDEAVPSLLLSESGRLKRVQGHRNFRIFAAMNPSTDTGKRELPPGIRTRFTEVFVRPSDRSVEDLVLLISTYLGPLLSSDERAASHLAKCYLDVHNLNEEKQLTDGAEELPHFSVRSLVRTLIYTNQNAAVYGLRRALYEGFLMSFVTMLGADSQKMVIALVERHLLDEIKNARSLLSQNPKRHQKDGSFIIFKHHLVPRGLLPPEHQPHYIITPFVERNLLSLARAVSVRRFPILLQGPTSSGKTSMIEYLAKISGNEYIRVNNHEHTDLQEYLGSYASGEDGRLQYREGVLVQALRRGQWIVLDELNLAPTDILEALNRLLDENRELFIPETQETVKPHPRFMLFATQNPAGLYGGRKHLSRAFRNRFLELHFADIPEDELEMILKERTRIPPSYCSRIVSVYKRLARSSQPSRLFEKRNSFATLRDLFRWASRGADSRDQLAWNGFMLLAERVRDPVEKNTVKEIIEEVVKVRIDEQQLYSSLFTKIPAGEKFGIVWTPAMQRLLVLTMTALENHEPVLLVGETSTGKTQVCQTIAKIYGQPLHIVNAHSNMETSDLIGSQRPVRNKAEKEAKLKQVLQSSLGSGMNGATSSATLEELISHFERVELVGNDNLTVQDIKNSITQVRSLFEWADGSLVTAMKRGEPFLLDEISLAEDSVLERLNSVLESHRSILLAEKGTDDSFVRAAPRFQFLATMNPGGDYGKRELTSALRNRLTEIWVPPLSEQVDILPILDARLGTELSKMAPVMIEFARWFRSTFSASDSISTSLRELLSWTDFVHKIGFGDSDLAVLHGAALVFIDSLGANPATMTSATLIDIEEAQQASLRKLGDLLRRDMSAIYFETPLVSIDINHFRCGDFSIPCSHLTQPQSGFIFEAPTTRKNTLRILRALQLPRPILLEGDPGVGKTALVEAIAQAAGKRLTRVNLSDQTDLMDLFGSDTPVEDATAAHFSWRDGPLLRAMRKGDWVLLDEMNLATQSILEGLNSCFDHRQQVYIAELDRTFVRHQDFVLFATQNPHHQGAGRKGLPASFVNRFTVVYASALTDKDLMIICQSNYGDVEQTALIEIVSTVSQCSRMVQSNRSFDSIGGPWEFNLRDISRWLGLYQRYDGKVSPVHFHNLIISQRFRTDTQRRLVQDVHSQERYEASRISLFSNLSVTSYQLGVAILARDEHSQRTETPDLDLWSHLLPHAQSLIHCINQKWPAILVGGSGTGKSTLIRKLAAVRGAKLLEFAVTQDMDTMDLIGGIEQHQQDRQVADFLNILKQRCIFHLENSLSNRVSGRDRDCLLGVYWLCQANKPDMEKLQINLTALAELIPNFQDHVSTLDQMTSSKSQDQDVRFKWTDGVLVETVSKGYWLVLDNANTCSSAVLDRLNALLEPDGKLIVSEQHEKDGSLRSICPHDDFRIFLTMDPGRGELSRSMRNRSVEIHLELAEDHRPQPGSLLCSTEAAIFRWRRLETISLSQYEDALQSAVATVCVDHLSLRDLFLASPREYKALCGMLDHRIARELANYQSLPHALFDKIHQFYLELTRSCHMSEQEVKDQPLHTETNDALLQLAKDSGLELKASRLGWLLESFLTLCRIRSGLQHAATRATSVQLRDMTALERSIAAQKIPNLTHDPSKPLIVVCDILLTAADEMLTALIFKPTDEVSRQIDESKALLALLQDVVDMGTAETLQSGVLAIYLRIADEVLLRLSSTHPATAHLAQSALSVFRIHSKLRCGQSLSTLWSFLRPQCAEDGSQLNDLTKLDSIMLAFDSVHKTPHFLETAVNIQAKLLATRVAVFGHTEDVARVLQELQDVTLSMTANIDANIKERGNYFAGDFEALCQNRDLVFSGNPSSRTRSSDQLISRHAAILAGRLTKSLACDAEPNHGSSRLLRLTAFGGWSNPSVKVASWKGTYLQDLLKRLYGCSDEPLHALDDLCRELKWLSASISEGTRDIKHSQLNLLSNEICALIGGVLMCHRDLINPHLLPSASVAVDLPASFFSSLMDAGGHNLFHQDVPVDHHFRQVWEIHLWPAMTLMLAIPDVDNHKRLGAAIIHSSLGLLRLWVPDKPTDPALDILVKRDRHHRRKGESYMKLQALKIFESTFSGQSTSLRIRRLQHEIGLIGLEPVSPPVVRLSASDVSQVHDQFCSVLHGIIDKKPETVLLSNVEGPFQNKTVSLLERSHQADSLRQNIDQMARRICESPAEYSDLTVPVLQLLQILDLGTAMLDWSEEDQGVAPISQPVMYISEHTPLLGATPTSITRTMRPTFYENMTRDGRVLSLEMDSLAAAFNPRSLSGSRTWPAIFSSFESCYAQWKIRLEIDRSKEAKKAKYYEYRGEDESEDAETAAVKVMFPNFDNDGEPKEPASSAHSFDSKALAVRMANHQASIFSPDEDTAPARHYLLQSLDIIASLLSQSRCEVPIISPMTMLPALFIRLQQELHFLQGPEPIKAYNIYADPKVDETRKLLNLVRQIKDGVEVIKEAWPEHAVPVDILALCHEIFTTRLSDPLAKFFPRMEKLHYSLNEWQMMASKECSVASFIEELTTLIVAWRRLELSSWSCLLAEESLRCEEDAKSWWFVVYEVVISIPLRLVEEGDDCSSHACDLVDTLIRFLQATSIGQFSCRLRVLESFHRMVGFGVGGGKLPELIASSLSNVIEHFKRYEATTQKLLQDGRRGLEKEVVEQVKLASWKDTNVTTLRESARRSHHKLFKIIKKFRALLSQHMEARTPTNDSHDRNQISQVTDVHNVFEDQSDVLRVIERHIDGWGSAPRRRRDPLGAAASMLRLYKSSNFDLDIGHVLHQYGSNLTSTMTELRSQTPSKVDNDNRNVLLHLKARKRRLLIDVLKDVRHMGIRRNLNAHKIERQRSLPYLLSASPALQNSGIPFAAGNIGTYISSAQTHFHGFLDLADAARKHQEQHSEDLSSVDIGRCVGFLEGFLHVMQDQRTSLDRFLRGLASLQRARDIILNLQLHGPANVINTSGSTLSKQEQLRSASSWLPQILEAACSVLESLAERGSQKSQPFIDCLRSYQARLKEDSTEVDKLLASTLPNSTQTRPILAKFESLQALLADLQKDLEMWASRKPDAGFLIQQLLPWTDWSSFHVANVSTEGRSRTLFDDFKQRLWTAIDMIFVRLQAYPDMLGKLPSTTEEPSWLSRACHGLASTVSCLQMTMIASTIEETLNIVSNFEGVDLQKALSLCIIYAPVIMQFYNICQNLVERYADSHSETCRLSYILVKSFNHVASDGFCGPAERSSNAEENSGQVENGTGLAEGQGLEDISKEIGDDEDLSSLAEQSRAEESKEEIQSEEDAVDAGNDELQGEMDQHGEVGDDADGDSSGSEAESADDMEEEAGSVDNLDPSAVDEKLWEGLADEKENGLEKEDGGGKPNNDQTAARQSREKDQCAEADEIPDDDHDEEAMGEEDLQQHGVEKADRHLQQEQALELSEDMQLDGDQETKENSISDDGLDEFSEVDREAEQQPPINESDGSVDGEHDDGPMDDRADEVKVDTDSEINDQAGEFEVTEEQPEHDEEDRQLGDQNHTREGADENAAEDVVGSETGGLGASPDDGNDARAGSSSKASASELPPVSREPQAADASENDSRGDLRQGTRTGDSQHTDAAERRQAEAFQKLGDVLENWHRQRRQILQASEEKAAEQNQMDVAVSDFEHVENDDDEGNNQALGTATNEQAQALDQSKALEDEDYQEKDRAPPEPQEPDAEAIPLGLEQFRRETAGDDKSRENEVESGAYISDNSRKTMGDHFMEDAEAGEDVDDTDHPMPAADLSPSELPPLTSPDEAARLWSHYASLTHVLSLVLIEQLRLILLPTQASKLRGDFRTGKRLNIKRIIPYIASNYKRDKIWMRRSVPSKRNYQIMIAVDDSKSMMEGGAHALAFETLALLCKSLSMLEAGEVCVVGFGDEAQIRIAHSFDTPLTNASGARIYQNFSFQQQATNVRGLMLQSIELFREARAKGSRSVADLWQLQLIISDGICEDHDLVRRLVRQALEERIMVVFVIVDSQNASGNSIMDLSEAVFEPGEGDDSGGEMKLKRKRYLDGFPFPYYVVVREVADLPGVLATALKGWFREIVDVS